MSKGKHGGAREGAGRPKKADEIRLAEKMQNILDDETVLIKLADKVRESDMKAIELWSGYRWGKPTQRVETKEVEELPEVIFVRAKK